MGLEEAGSAFYRLIICFGIYGDLFYLENWYISSHFAIESHVHDGDYFS